LAHHDQQLGGKACQTALCHTLPRAVLEKLLALNQQQRLTMASKNSAVSEQLLELEHGRISLRDGNPTIPAIRIELRCSSGTVIVQLPVLAASECAALLRELTR
jgi:hypothetical protein